MVGVKVVKSICRGAAFVALPFSTHGTDTVEGLLMCLIVMSVGAAVGWWPDRLNTAGCD